MTHVLLIEDEPVLRALTVQGLAKLPGVSVFDAGTLRDGLALLDAQPMDLIISDIDLPGRSGLELVGELGRRNLSTPILYVSAYLKAYGAQIPPHANIEVLEKPVPLEVLRDRVKARLKVPAVTRAPFSVADYLQLACMGRHSVRIEVTCADGSSAWVVVVNGEVWSAHDGHGDGVEAFHRFAFQVDSSVECKPQDGDAGERTIHAPWEGLLLESARLMDEARRSPHPKPALDAEASEAEFADFENAPPAAPPAPSQPPPSDDEAAFNALLDDGVAAMLRRDLAAAAAIFQRALQLKPTHPLVLANLKRLADLGHTSILPVGAKT